MAASRLAELRCFELIRAEPPNMRLKLSGLLLRESAVASPCGPPRGGPVPCAGQHAARSL